MAHTALGVPIGTNQQPWKPGTPQGSASANLCTNSATAPTPAAYAHSTTKPVTTHASGVYVLDVQERCNQIALRFFGTDANNETGEAYVYGISEYSPDGVNKEYLGEYIGNLSFTLGAATVASGSRFIPNTATLTAGKSALWADTITATVDEVLNGWEVVADTADGPAIAIGDIVGYRYIVVVLKLGTAEGLGFIWREV